MMGKAAHSLPIIGETTYSPPSQGEGEGGGGLIKCLFNYHLTDLGCYLG
jgi:hypothetical protein